MNKVLVKVILLLVLVISLVFALVVMGSGRKKVMCNTIKVSFTKNYQFVTEKQITNMVYDNIPRIHRGLLDTLNTDRLERKIEKHPWVRKAEIYKNYGLNDSLKKVGILNVRIIQEEPLFRVITEDGGFYMTEDGYRMPLSYNYTPKLVVVSGNISSDILKNEVVEFVKYINKSSFWKSQIQQIHIRSDDELVLVPRVGSHLILFGKVEKLDLRFSNLMAVYKKGFPKYGTWDKYKYVNLKFDNQVVCTLK